MSIMKRYKQQKQRQRGGIFRSSRRQREGIFRGSRRQRGGIFRGSRRQKGGFFPLIPAGIIAGIKAAGIASALGAAGALGSEAVGAVSRKIRGA